MSSFSPSRLDSFVSLPSHTTDHNVLSNPQEQGASSPCAFRSEGESSEVSDHTLPQHYLSLLVAGVGGRGPGVTGLGPVEVRGRKGHVDGENGCSNTRGGVSKRRRQGGEQEPPPQPQFSRVLQSPGHNTIRPRIGRGSVEASLPVREDGRVYEPPESLSLDTMSEDGRHIRNVLFGIETLCMRITPHAPTRAEIALMWDEACATEKNLLTEKAVIDAAEGFEFPADVTRSDMEKFESVGWDFTALARLRISEMASDRINEESIRANIDPDDPYFNSMLEIARGVPVDRDKTTFVPNGGRGESSKLRAKYVKLHSPLNKIMYKNWCNGKTILLPLKALEHIEGAHFSMVHCNLEPGKLRLITDSSNAPEGTHALNSEAVKQQAKQKWGPIDPVMIHTLIVKVVTFMKENPGEAFTLFKMDMKAAFSLFSILPDDVQLLGFMLTDEVMQYELTGSFGKTDYPYVFNVFTNVARRGALQRIIRAIVDMYVDDVMGITVREFLERNLAIIRGFFEAVWGVGSVAEDKTFFSSEQLEFIGYDVNIVEGRVRMSKKNRLKTIRILFRMNEDVSVTVLDVMRLASYASRYVGICPVMAPFSGHIYNMICWRTNIKAVIKTEAISQEFKDALRLWRCVITMMEIRRDDERFFRSFASYMPLVDREYAVDFDASLEGAGVLIMRKVGEDWTVLRAISLQFGPEYTAILKGLQYQSSMQNSCEFIAALIGLTCAISYGARDGSIQLTGDSQTALRWLETWKFRPGLSTNASIVYVALGLRHNLRFTDTVFKKGVDNKVCDALSRGTHPSALGFNASQYSDEEDSAVSHLLSLCTPSNQLTQSHDFVTKWVEAEAFAASLDSPP